MKTNFHTHSTWCDGRNTTGEMAQAAIDKGFSALGFSSHALLPGRQDGMLSPETIADYAAEVRALRDGLRGEIDVYLGVEADYVPGFATPSKAAYAHLGLDYMIGSVHFVARGGAHYPVDHSPEALERGIAEGFGGDGGAFVRAYFAAEREMVAGFDFDVVGHPDLVRKFNARRPWFDESAPWYEEELVATADAIAASGKIVEVNTGAISRGWLDDAYPSPRFRALLRERGVRFVLSSDAHAASALDCAFDRFADAEDYVGVEALVVSG